MPPQPRVRQRNGMGIIVKSKPRSGQGLLRAILITILCWAALAMGSVSKDEDGTGMLLPDGREFVSWERPLQFTRTYYVDNRNPRAADLNPGTKELPFLTINKAAQLLQPGERAVIMPGVYRERVDPVRGGSGPEKMISYEAAPGATVYFGFDRNGAYADMRIDVDLDALTMTWSVAGAVPQVPTGKHSQQDLSGQAASDLRKPGPLVVVPDSSAKVNIDPRRQRLFGYRPGSGRPFFY